MIGEAHPTSPVYRALPGRMSQTSIERLRDYLAQLPPQAQALLMREFERALERGQDTAVATLVLEQLRKIVRKTETDEAPPPRTDAGPTSGQLLLVTKMELFSTSASVARAGRSRSTGTRWMIRCQAPCERLCCASSRT